MTTASTGTGSAKKSKSRKAAPRKSTNNKAVKNEAASVQAGATPGQTPPVTVAAVLGEMTWLMTQSKGHRLMFLGDLEWMAMPALLLRQYRIFRDDNKQPVGLALWAKVSPEVEERLAQGGANKLKPEDWNSGDILWLVDLVAPFGRQDDMLNELRSSVLKGETLKFHRTTPDGKREVVELKGE